MCGIAGFELSTERDEERIAQRLLAGLASRGPDRGWFAPCGSYGLVQTRLAIIDLSDRVVYPMADEQGCLWLLFNGEIYNHTQLRSELEGCGHSFRTRCDAEVVLHGYEQWGVDVFPRLDGMFALALLDQHTNEILLTRDSLGIKPLAYTSEGRFAFASDVISLVAAGLSTGLPDQEALGDFAAFHYLPSHPGVRGLEILEPGVALIRDRDGVLRHNRWCAQPFTSSLGPRRTCETVGHALDESVRSQLEADVPVGVFLSSGIDSSLILDSAVRAGARPVAFTVGFQGHGDFDETHSARRFAEQLGVRHVCHDLQLGFHEALDSHRDAYDQPFADASAIATVAIARVARQEVTVGLSGTGGDDLFAGYYRHRAHLMLPLIALMPNSLRTRMTRWGGLSGQERRSTLQLARSYAARLCAADVHDPLRQYLSLIGSSERAALSDLMPEDPFEARVKTARRLGLDECDNATMLRSIQAFELRTYLPCDLLNKEDRASMAVGLETRVPLLGQELLTLAEEGHTRQMIRMQAGKLMLRRLASKRLPDYLTKRRKRGFAVPLGALFRGPWQGPATAWLRETDSCLLDSRRIANELESNRLSPADTWAASVLIAWEQRLTSARLTGAYRDSLSTYPAVPSVIRS